MSESSQGPTIRLDIDQEIYVDSVLVDDMIVDATVATEVTSLDKVGDAYVLEGAIVFSGLLARPSTAKGYESAATENSAAPRNIHHRLPFLLRVPAKSQPRGIVNVASRISSWNVDVVSENWVHMEADLQISGLNGQQGFHFQCGPQEFGSLFFQAQTADHGQDSTVLVNDGEPSLQSTQERVTEESTPYPDEDLEQTESFNSSQLEDVTAATMRMGVPAQKELADFDRALEGEPTLANDSMEMRGFETAKAEETLPSDDSSNHQQDNNTVHAVQSAQESEPTSAGLDDEDSNRREPIDSSHLYAPNHKEQEAYPEFDFAHQISPDSVEETRRAPLTPVEVPFSAARSFSDTGFSPHTGFRQEQEDSGEGPVPDERSSGSSIDTTDTPTSISDGESTSEGMNEEEFERSGNSLWSFVDFNQPERNYTLRYVIVMEEETLQSVADRIGCTKADLLTENGLSTDEVFVGQTLRIPVHGILVPKLSS